MTLNRQKIMLHFCHLRVQSLMQSGKNMYNVKSNIQFLQQCLNSHEILCHRCFQPIPLGSHFEVTGSGRNRRKYYHPTCFEAMWH